jgi:hypothetical protein
MQSDDPATQKVRYPPGAPLWEWSAEQPSAGTATPAHTLIVYTSSTRLVGQVDPSRRRLSDYLNDTSTSYLELAEATTINLLDGSEATTVAASVTLRKASIWIACPVERALPTSARVATQQWPVMFALGPFAVSGTLHRRRTDATQLAQLLGEGSRKFIPVSGAQVRYLPNNRFDGAAGTVLVNTSCVDYWSTPGPGRPDAPR